MVSVMLSNDSIPRYLGQCRMSQSWVLDAKIAVFSYLKKRLDYGIMMSKFYDGRLTNRNFYTTADYGINVLLIKEKNEG